MLKKTVITLLLLVYFYFAYFSLIFTSYWLYFSIANDCYLTGPSSCQISLSPILTSTPLFLSPLLTLVFIKSKNIVKWLLILIPFLIIPIYIIYNNVKY